MSETKTCTECREDLLVTSFYPHPHTKDRRQPICIECKSKMRRSGPIDHGYAERHEAKRKQEAELEAKLKEKELETESFRFETQERFKPRWKVA